MYETVTDGTLPNGTGAGRATGLPLTRARRAALAIGVPLCLAFVAFTGLNMVANVGRASFPLDYSIPVSAGRVGVTVSGGNILLQQVAGGGPARLTGTAYYSLVRPHLTRNVTAGSASFGYSCDFPVGNCGLDATLRVPRLTAVSVSTGGGDVTADGTTGAVTLSTGGGDVTVSQVAGNLTLHTDGGDIQATGVTAAQVTADTGGGNVSIAFTRVPRDVRVRTDGGDITITVPGTASYHVTTQTAGGDINDSVPENSSSPNVITATSGGGNITIRQTP